MATVESLKMQSKGVVERPVLYIFKRKRRKFISTAASETERKRPDDAFFYDETVYNIHVGSISLLPYLPVDRFKTD